MSQIKATVVADSINEFGNRLTTLLVVMPRYILAEFNTHRILSKNSASSRAIPFEKLLKTVEENPFIPIAWQKDHKGMQGFEYYEDNKEIAEITRRWLNGRDYAVEAAKNLGRGINDQGVTKGLVNRGLEAYMYHTVLVSGTEWENFFHLRCPQYSINITNTDNDGEKIFKSKLDAIKHYPEPIENLNQLDWLKLNKGQADIHMMATAEAIYDAMNESIPDRLEEGEYHIPFGEDIELDDIFSKIKVAVSRGARTSYTIVGDDGKEMSYEKLIKLFDEKLLPSGHWSPFEHIAKAMSQDEYEEWGKYVPHFNKEGQIIGGDTELGWCGNFRGFVQYRKTFANENITE